MSQREWNENPRTCTLAEILDANKPIEQILESWPVMYMVRLDLWPKLVEFLGLEWDPENLRPFHINYRGCELWRFRPEFAQITPEVIAVEVPAILPDDHPVPNYFDLTRLSSRKPRTQEIEYE